MINSWIVIAVLAGLASALIFAAAGVPTFAAAAVFLLAPAPLLIVGLGWGWVVALIAGAIGAVALSLVIGWAFAVPYLLATALPAAIVSRLALQQRPAPPVQGGEGEVRLGDVEWYPEGRVLIAIALMAGALATGLVIMAGPDAASFRASTDQLLDRVLAIQEDGPQSPAAEAAAGEHALASSPASCRQRRQWAGPSPPSSISASSRPSRRGCASLPDRCRASAPSPFRESPRSGWWPPRPQHSCPTVSG